MNFRQAQTAAPTAKAAPPHNADFEREGIQRLAAILAVNAETAREKELFRTRREQFEAALMKNPLTTERAFSYFGLMLGTFPPAAIFSRLLFDARPEITLVALLVLVNLICAVAGYFSGKLVGKIVFESKNRSRTSMLLTIPLVGVLWGILTGGGGGILIFVVGAFFGALVAAMVGGIAFPIFTIFHRLLKKGEMIELKHFLPLAFGIVFAISAFILGL